MTPRVIILLHLLLGLTCLCTASATPLSDLGTSCPNFFYDAVYDLQANTACRSPHVTEFQPITASDNCECCSRGTLNISLSSPASSMDSSSSSSSTRRRRSSAVLVDLWFSPNPGRWAFNLGDSQSNNGYKGDSGHSMYDAEVHLMDKDTFRIYRNDKQQGLPLPPHHDVTFGKPSSTRLSLIVRDGEIQWVSDSHMGVLADLGLFGLAGQTDDMEAAGGHQADRNIFLGLNQVVNGQSKRRGSGLCKAAIRFLCDEELREMTTSTTTTTTTTKNPRLGERLPIEEVAIVTSRPRPRPFFELFKRFI